MALGTRDQSIEEGDLVKITSHKKTRKHAIPLGTIAPISRVVPGLVETYQLKGYEDLYLSGLDMELVSYVRKGMH